MTTAEGGQPSATPAVMTTTTPHGPYSIDLDIVQSQREDSLTAAPEAPSSLDMQDEQTTDDLLRDEAEQPR